MIPGDSIVASEQLLILMEKPNKDGIIQYEVMVVNNDSIVKKYSVLELTPIEKVSSLITYIYTDESDETEDRANGLLKNCY